MPANYVEVWHVPKVLTYFGLRSPARRGADGETGILPVSPNRGLGSSFIVSSPRMRHQNYELDQLGTGRNGQARLLEFPINRHPKHREELEAILSYEKAFLRIP